MEVRQRRKHTCKAHTHKDTESLAVYARTCTSCPMWNSPASFPKPSLGPIANRLVAGAHSALPATVFVAGAGAGAGACRPKREYPPE